MKKKLAARVQRSAAKKQKTNTVKAARGEKSAPPVKVAPKPSFKDDPRFAQAVQNYEAGLKAMQERKFERAKALLEKVTAGGSRELADRAAVHLNTCNQQLGNRSGSGFKTVEEHYDFAIALMNSSDYEGARSHLEKLAKQSPKSDFVWYGMAVLDCLTQRFEPALKNLQEAIRLNSAVRYQARNDNDFQNLADDPRFTELLYPEPGAEAAPSLPAAANFKRR
jgi:tetratricopeptide (TPR) repeat protein